MQLKHCNRTSCIAVWSNSKSHGQLLACSSTNPKNPSLYDLQILSIDLTDPSKNLNIEGKSQYNIPFRCLAWGTFRQKQGQLPYGLLFGGMENGTCTLWNPSDMIANTDQLHQSQLIDQKSLLYYQQPQQDAYPIFCAQWNPLKNNYLAYGSTSLLIFDVNKNIQQPQTLKLNSKNFHQDTYITSVSWNKQVPHVLASAGNDGIIILYDIKAQKCVYSFGQKLPYQTNRQVQIAWSKHISTQIAITFDDQKKKQLQIWDLRNKKGPIVAIDKRQSKGINSMDWSQLDYNLILTASRDHKIVCWNYQQDEQPLTTKQIKSQITKVAWSKSLPSIYSITTTKGLEIYSLDDRFIQSYIPKWLKIPVSSTFNGNQSILIHSDQRGNTMHQYHIQSKPTQDLQSQLQILQQFLQDNNSSSLTSLDGQAGQFWKLIANKKQKQDNNTNIYNFLNFNKQKIIKEVEKYTGKKRQSFKSTIKSQKQSKSKISKADYIPVSGHQAANFFCNLSQQPNLDKNFPSNSNNNYEDQFTNDNQNIKFDMVPRNFNWDIGKEKLIKQSMLIGNYQGAIDAALKCGRTAQALIIAYSIDQTTFNSTLKTFFTQTTDNFISQILRHIAFKDSQQLVKKYQLKKWKQCIALIFSLSSSTKRKSLLNLLAQRLSLQSQQYQQASVYCYILSQQFQKIIQLYHKKISKQKPNSLQRKLQIINLSTRLLAILTCFTTQIKITNNFQKIIRQLALICLQANKKVLSYTLLTKYIAQSSFQYIDYLIHNTQQLASYRTYTPPTISLPIMTKKQQKQQKQKKPQKTPQEQLPTSIKPMPPPNPKHSKLPNKMQPFNPVQTEQSNQQIKKHKTNTPPPPPPPISSFHNKSQNIPMEIKSTQQKNKNKNIPPPPPPPPKKNLPPQHQKDSDKQQQDQKQPQTHHQPIHKIPHKTYNVPPPPPPPPRVTSKNPHEDNQSTNPNLNTKNQPFKYPQNNPISIPSTSSQTAKIKKTPPPPPPPPSNKKQQIQKKYQPAQPQNTDQSPTQKKPNPPSQTHQSRPQIIKTTTTSPPPPPPPSRNTGQRPPPPPPSRG